MERLRQLPNALETVERDRRLWRGFGLWLLAAGSWVGLLILLVMVDAAMGLGTGGLWLVLFMLIAAAGVGLIVGITAMVRGWDQYRTASAVETVLGLKQDEISTAIALSSGAGEAYESTSQSLRDEAIRRGDALANKVGSISLPQGGRVRRAMYALLAAAVLLVLSMVIWPGVWGAVVPRVLMPWADLPPYTSLKFDVKSEPSPIFASRAVTIEAVIRDGTEATAGEAWVVFERENGLRERVDMFRRVSKEGEAAYKYVLSLPGISQPGTQRYFIEAPGGRSKWHELDVLPTPLFERVTATLNYPSFTNWESSLVDLMGKQTPKLKALVGTQVQLKATSNLALQIGELTVYDEQGVVLETLTLSPVGDRAMTVQGDMGIEKTGRFELVLVGLDGSRSEQPFTGMIEAVADREPMVQILEPEPVLLAVEGWQVQVRARATDDVAIDTMSLHHSLNEQWAEPQAMEQQRQRNGMQAKATLDLKAIQAKPGDIVQYYVSATDVKNTETNDPGRVGESSLHTIRIISVEEYEDIARSQYRADDLAAEWKAFEEALKALEMKRDELLKEMEALQEQLKAQQGEPTPEQQKQMQELAEKFEQYRHEALDLAEQMRERSEQNQLYEFERDYKDLLRRTGMELQAQASAAGEMQRALGRENPGQMDRALQQFKKQDKPFNQQMQQERDQVTQDAEKLAQAGQMMESANRLSGIIEKQQALAKRFGEFANKEKLTPQEQLQLERLSREQQELKKELQETQQQLRQQGEAAAQLLPKMAASATGMAEAIDSMNIPGDQATASEAADAGDTGHAAAKAKEASEKLLSLLSECENQGQGQNAQGDLDQALGLSGQSLQQAVQQMQQSAQGVPGAPNQGQTGQTGQGSSGMSGGSMNFPVAGPQRPGERSDAQRGGDRRDRPRTTSGQSVDGEVEQTSDEPGVIDPGRVTQRHGMALDATVSPPVYEQATRAYFERLVEDEASE